MRRSVQATRTAAKEYSMDDYIENILAENLTIKRKLESKCEALAILNAEVEKMKLERDHLKKVIEDLRLRQLSSTSEPETTVSDSSRALKTEVDHLRQKLRDALGDVQALRVQLSQDKPIPNGSDDKVSRNLLREEELIQQIESLQRAKLELEADFQAVLDEKEELTTERDAYKCKLHRLNHECNVLLKGNSNGIIDLDALIMENRLLQERLLQAQEECQLSKQVMDRYKNMLQTKKHKGKDVLKFESSDNASAALLSKKQVKELLESYGASEVPGDDASVSELRSLCFALLDSLGDKSLALTHQKRANRILAARIAELQSRLEGHAKAVESPSTVLLEGYKSIVDTPRQMNFIGGEIDEP